ncbi:PaaI family thioesterase [Caulobacter segnis]|uniref:PaaI family thioesterase n=1 Tax=Caulobacter segnis TaxID=88688 RepID=UPI0024100006|nr:PaaI family thioesterase [Caulobacter segnis]MDG2521233.1 PaaI family thioesterase [Caulobacter segnis]
MTEESDRLAAVLGRIPYVKFLGLRAELAGDEMTVIMPASPHLIGNPMLPALHGGVLGAMMEVTAIAQLMVAQPLVSQPKTIDVSIEYLRSGRPLTTYARAKLNKIGRRIANVHVEAWQEQRGAPIAALRGHFLVQPEVEE